MRPVVEKVVVSRMNQKEREAAMFESKPREHFFPVDMKMLKGLFPYVGKKKERN